MSTTSKRARGVWFVYAALVAAFLAAAAPAGASTMQEIYAGVKVEDLVTAPEYAAGDTVLATYRLVNRSGATLTIPPNTEFSATFHLVGFRQHWIERLGPIKTIPSIPPETFFDGSRYAAGGAIIAVDGRLPDNTWAPDVALVFDGLVDTTGFPTGDYRFFVEYKRLFSDGGTVIQTSTADFHVTGPADTTPPEIAVPVALSVDATSPAGAIVSYEASAMDDVDGPVSVVCAPPSDSLFPIGDTAVECSASDSSGNSADAGFNVHVRGATEQIVDLMAVVAATPASGLNFMLNRALQAVNTGQISRACNELATFMRAMYELAKPPYARMTPAQASKLASDARRIRAVLAC